MKSSPARHAILAILLLAPAMSALAGWRLRIPAIHRSAAGAGSRHAFSAAPAAVATPFAFPEGRLEASYRDTSTGAVFTRHSCALQPHAALAAASRVLAASGWRQVFATASVALFESASGSCAAIAATPALNGGATVATLVQR